MSINETLLILQLIISTVIMTALCVKITNFMNKNKELHKLPAIQKLKEIDHKTIKIATFFLSSINAAIILLFNGFLGPYSFITMGAIVGVVLLIKNDVKKRDTINTLIVSFLSKLFIWPASIIGDIILNKNYIQNNGTELKNNKTEK